MIGAPCCFFVYKFFFVANLPQSFKLIDKFVFLIQSVFDVDRIRRGTLHLITVCCGRCGVTTSSSLIKFSPVWCFPSVPLTDCRDDASVDSIKSISLIRVKLAQSLAGKGFAFTHNEVSIIRSGWELVETRY